MTAADRLPRVGALTALGQRPAVGPQVMDQRACLQRLPLSLLLVVSLVALGVSAVVAVSFGPVRVPMTDVYAIVVDVAAPWLGLEPAASFARREVVLGIRFPRVVLGVVVGAGLPVAGAIMQAVLRNPLADPYLIGVSSGAGFGVVAALVAPAVAPAWLSLPVAAFAGSILAFGLVFAFARQARQLTPVRLILAGVAVASFLSALTQWMIVSSSDEGTVRRSLTWLLGSLTGVELNALAVPAGITAVAIVVGLGCAGWLDAMALGEEGAHTLGIDVDRFRLVMVVVCALLVGALVSVSGAIGFVALIIPHALRLLVGTSYRRLLPLSAIWGAIFLVWADVVARVARPGVEIPLGVVTALVGAPFFLLILKRSA